MSSRKTAKRRSPVETSSTARLRELCESNERQQLEIARLTGAIERSAAERFLLRGLIDQLPDLLFVKDTDSRFLVANLATAIDLRQSAPADLIGKSDEDFYPPELSRKFFEYERSIVASGRGLVDHEEISFDASAGEKWFSVTKVPFRNERGDIIGLLGTCHDITERRRADGLRTGQAQILEMITTSAPVEAVLDSLMRLVEGQLVGIFGSVLLLDADGVHLRHGAAPSLPTDYVRAIDGVAIGPAVGSCGTAAFRAERVIVADIATDPLWAGYRDVAAAHGLRSCWSTPILSHTGEVLGTFAMYSRETREPTTNEIRLVDLATHIAGIAIARRKAEDRIQFMAHHDALTGLPNRTLLIDRLAQAMLFAQRYDCWVTAVFIDLDNFKLVNDSLGHSAGDDLLKIVAQRMVASLRETDTVVRLGGDEFVVLLCNQPKRVEGITATLHKMRAAIAEPVHLRDHAVQIMCSMGVATYPGDGADAETLLANADAAMYRAKEVGRDNFQFYTGEMNSRARERLELHEELRNAVDRGELVLQYQPQFELQSGRLFAAEALVRWTHPLRGMLLPATFVSIAEESGLIVVVGDWVLRQACLQNKAWQDAGAPPVTVCVNVSARQFRDRELVSRVAAALRHSGLEAKYLELELTESVIMQDLQQAVATMRELEALGVKLAIDDFGTGYSSLSALKRFPVARLKIDRSFIRDLAHDENDKAIAAAIISLGHRLNLRVIAEGVETDEQIDFLRENRCDEMQGFYLSGPLSADELYDRLTAAARDADSHAPTASPDGSRDEPVDLTLAAIGWGL